MSARLDARGARGARGAGAWLGVAALLALGALTGWALNPTAIDWQPARFGAEPWRAFTAIGVHYSVAHLLGNLGGVGLAALLGVAARVPTRLGWAWFAAWPLTQLGLLVVAPSLAHYGGLSGVLHAGGAIVIVDLLVCGTRAQRGVGVALALGLLAKLLSEAPWGPALRVSPAWDIAIAPIAHSSGAFAGVVCASVAHWCARRH